MIKQVVRPVLQNNRSFKPSLAAASINSPTPLVPVGSYDLEIGAGVGWHAIKYAQENQGRRLIAIERTSNRYEKFLNRYETHQSPANLMMVHGDVRSWLAVQDGRIRLQKIFLLYPNPYLKTKHHHKRWSATPFMGYLHTLLEPGGEVHLSTNISDYAEQTLTQMTEKWGFSCEQNFRVSPSESDSAQTNFEKKYLNRGETCYRMIFSKPCGS